MSDEVILDATKFNAFKFFTVDSNILMGIISLLFAIFEYKLIKNKIKVIPKELYIIKFMFTVSIMLTFFTTVLYLAPFAPKGFFSMFQNSNLFFHFVIPVLSFITFILFEKNDFVKFKNTFLGLIPTFIYAFFYVINLLVHLENGRVSSEYDWYGFAQGNLVSTIIVFFLMHLFTYIICLIVWFLNKKRKKK